jgi:hypothetical protein
MVSRRSGASFWVLATLVLKASIWEFILLAIASTYSFASEASLTMTSASVRMLLLSVSALMHNRSVNLHGPSSIFNMMGTRASGTPGKVPQASIRMGPLSEAPFQSVAHHDAVHNWWLPCGSRPSISQMIAYTSRWKFNATYKPNQQQWPVRQETGAADAQYKPYVSIFCDEVLLASKTLMLSRLTANRACPQHPAGT